MPQCFGNCVIDTLMNLCHIFVWYRCTTFLPWSGFNQSFHI